MKFFLNLINTHAKLFSALIIGIAILIISVPVVRTIDLYFEYLEGVEQLGARDPGLTETKQYPHEAFEHTDISPVIFEAIGGAAKQHDVIVKNISTPVVFKEDDHLLLTEEITLEGDFIKIMRCINDADEKLGLIKVASLKFERTQSQKSETLLLSVYFQMIKTIENEVE
jgi:hypothetical protein